MAESERKNEFVNEWMNEIKAGERYREKYSSQKRWPDFRNYYRGQWKSGIVPVNLVFSFGRALLPQVYFRSPRVTATATKPELSAHARVVEAVDNWLIRETKLKQTLKRAVIDAYLTGTSPIKLGYDSEFGYLPQQAVDVDTSTITQAGKKDDRLIEYKTSIKPGMPWAIPEHAENVIVPFGYREADYLPWIAHRILRFLEDVQQDQKYKGTSALQGTRRADLKYVNERSVFLKEESIKYAELFEIRDYREKRIITLCENKVILDDDDALQIEEMPWEFLIFNPDPEYFWGISDVRILEPQQLEYNEIRTQASRHRKIALLKFLYQKGAMKSEQLDRFLSGEVGPAIEIDAESLAAAITMLQPHIPPDLAGEAQQVLNDVKMGLGFNEQALASMKAGTPPTATETMTASESFDARINERKDILADVMVNIIRKWNQYIFSFWTGERVIQVAGPGSEQNWVKYTGDQLRGEYSLNIDPDSGMPITKQLRMQFVDGVMKQYGGDPMVDQVGLRTLHLKEYDWILPGISGLVLPPANPLMGQMMAAERQPAPGASSPKGNPPGTNKGGGNAGSSPDNPMEFDQFKAKMGEK